MKNILDAIQWKAKQKYSQFRCHLGGGYYIWQLEDRIKFVSRTGDAFSHILYVCQGHEKVEMAWCSRWIQAGNAGQSIIDCGANIGYFSAFIAQACAVSKIIAIEGNKRTAELCKENMELLEIKNVNVVQAILSDNPSDKLIIPDKPGKEPWQQAIKTDSASAIYPTLTLDNVVANFQIQPSLVKIDCEGFESLILKGATYLLGSIRPALIIECNDTALKKAGSHRKELFDYLKRANYKLFFLASFTSFHDFGVEFDETFPSSEFNFAAIPNDEANLSRWNKSIELF